MYPEIWKPRDEAPTFPTSCPSCGAPRVSGSEPGETSYRATVKYGCGGTYTLKTQIQTHTDKWWGQCGAQEQPSEPEKTQACTVWGIAARRGSTADAARGAFTAHEYPDGKFDRRDWLHVISVVRGLASRGYKG